MKKCLFLLGLCAFSAAGASAQLLGPTYGPSLLNSEPQMFTIPDHPQHAVQTPLAQEQDLLERSTYIYAHGERPLWEVMPPPPPGPPLGDVARSFREEHAILRKSRKIWND